jgi:TolB-like protein
MGRRAQERVCRPKEAQGSHPPPRHRLYLGVATIERYKEVRFGHFRFDLRRNCLLHDGERVELGGRALDILRLLAVAEGAVVSKDELMTRLWPGRTVAENNLHVHISGLRKALDEHGEDHSYVVTVPGRGYRLVLLSGSQPAGSSASATQHLPLPDKPSIAVLPFASLSGNPEQEYFAEGMVEDLITSLSRLRWLFVIARNSTLTYRGRSVDVRQVGAELGVRYVLEGSVRSAGTRLRISAQLVEAETGGHVWAERYDRAVEDIFAVQDEITDTIAATLEPEISAAERERARRKPPTHLGSWEVYQRGMWHMLRRNREDFSEARRLFGEAIKLDPNFASAHASFAVSEFWQITHGFTKDAPASRAELLASASRAVELDPRDSLAHSAMGLAFMECREHTKAIAEHAIAIALNPNSSFGQWCHGYALNFAGRHAEALAKFDLALRLSPRDPGAWSYSTLRASALYQLKRYEEAAQAAEDAMRTQLIDVVWPLVHRSAALGQMDRRQEAEAVINELRLRRPELTIRTFCAWPHNQARTVRSLEHIVEGLRKAGLPEGR